MLYQTYTTLCKQKKIFTGFSHRLPDYATKYWLDQFEHCITTIKGSKKNFLDIGAGSGRLSTLLLNTYFSQGAAIEVQVDHTIWKPLLQKHPGLKLYEGLLQDRIQDLISNHTTFDFIVLAEVFEHIPLCDVNGFLQALKKLLSDDGKIFLTTPNAVVLGPAEKSHMWHKRQPYGHHKHYTLKEMKEILEHHGFEITRHTFEGNIVKKHRYNRFFYPAARWDQKLLTTKKLPAIARKIYHICSSPFITATEGIF
ncbi:MAG: class I SAM-dependent methyltransferase, partial [bacterium]